MASDSNPKSDLENSESQNETTSPIQEISPDEKLSEEYFHCSICKTKHLRVLKFDQLEELRLHLAQDHFNDLILKDLKEQLLKNPVCPMTNCESLFNQLKLVSHTFFERLTRFFLCFLNIWQFLMIFFGALQYFEISS